MEKWHETRDTLHLLTQIIGKIRLGLSPAEPEWGHAGLFISSNGITTGPIFYGKFMFELELDLTNNLIRFLKNGSEEIIIPPQIFDHCQLL